MTFRFTLRYFVVGLALLATAAFAQASPDDALLKRLAETLLGSWNANGYSPATLLPGALPDDVGFPLPHLTPATLIGSQERRYRGELTELSVYLETDLTTEAAMRVYREWFADLGWTGWDDPQREAGFASHQDTFQSHFCAPDGG